MLYPNARTYSWDPSELNPRVLRFWNAKDPKTRRIRTPAPNTQHLDTHTWTHVT